MGQVLTVGAVEQQRKRRVKEMIREELDFFKSRLASISKEPGEDDANVEEEEESDAAAVTLPSPEHQHDPATRTCTTAPPSPPPVPDTGWQMAGKYYDEDYEVTPDEKRKSRGDQIIKTFLSKQSPQRVDIAEVFADQCRENLELSPCKEIFSNCRKAVHDYLSGAPFADYQNSMYFDRFLQWKMLEVELTGKMSPAEAGEEEDKEKESPWHSRKQFEKISSRVVDNIREYTYA
ncbi:G protein-coupled receptor kinase 5 [Lates japonicus]|uniref:G protein-coupled receptor kinase 5 n=1 Tax=Lates japonicus TaxID=270547 RepID=A0AAD3RKK8_LATJO|nr:G protein-coupled receptor kinase 5 [Lates japonicus]